MKKYVIWESHKEIDEIKQIRKGCTIDDPMPVARKDFNDLEEARKALERCATEVEVRNGAAGVFYRVKESWISEARDGLSAAELKGITPMGKMWIH